MTCTKCGLNDETMWFISKARALKEGETLCLECFIERKLEEKVAEQQSNQGVKWV